MYVGGRGASPLIPLGRSICRPQLSAKMQHRTTEAVLFLRRVQRGLERIFPLPPI